jgi:predicted site-specific integrase-resolvase
MFKYVKAKEAAEHYHISESNLRLWARQGKIPTQKTEGGRYNYLIHNEKIIPETSTTNTTVQWTPYIIYARVSSRKQQADLERQCAWLKHAYPTYTLVTDIGSGIDYKRKGFQTILERLFQGSVKEVVVAHSDRFSRFGFDLFEWVFEKFKARLINLDRSDGDGEDMVGDLMEILTVFSARYHGKRKYKKIKDLPRPEPEKVVQ